MPSDIAAELEAVRDVLRAMSRSQPDLDAVLGSACEHAVKLCGAEFGFVFVPEGTGLRMAGSYGAPARMLTYLRELPILPAGRSSSTGRAALSGRVEWIEDVFADPEWAMGGAQQAGDYRTSLSVPILKEGRLIGVFTVGWKEVMRFSQRVVDLVETFADQAAIRLPWECGSPVRANANLPWPQAFRLVLASPQFAPFFASGGSRYRPTRDRKPTQDNGRRSPRKLLRAVVARLLGRKPKSS